MKKYNYMIAMLVCALAISLTACGNKKENASEERITSDFTSAAPEISGTTEESMEPTQNAETNDVTGTSCDKRTGTSTKSQKQPTKTQQPAKTSKSAQTKIYHTSWGSRPHEFECVTTWLDIEQLNVYIHVDRYGNAWYDHSPSATSGHGKNIYAVPGYGYVQTAYFGSGRWSGMNNYWTEYGDESRNQPWLFNAYPNPWGTSYKMQTNPVSDGVKLDEYFSMCVNYMNATNEMNKDMVGQALKDVYDYTDEQFSLLDCGKCYIPNWGTAAP